MENNPQKMPSRPLTEESQNEENKINEEEPYEENKT